jgi:hypothetical protein
MNRVLVSKVLAAIWLAVPLAAMAVADDPHQLAQLHSMSRDQLITLATGFYDDTFSKTLLGAALGGLAYLGLVEGLAWVIRWVWGMLLGPERRRGATPAGNSAAADA